MSLRDVLDKAQSSYPLDGFLLCDFDIMASPYYFGYRSTGTAWVIKKLDTGTGELRYANGLTDYSTNWTNRAALTYTLPDP